MERESEKTLDDDDENDQIWGDLVVFVKGSGGDVHPSLQLRGGGPSRGVIASSPISEGDLLIRLPASCVISGEKLGPHAAAAAAAVIASSSPWLRCLGAFLQAKKHRCFDDVTESGAVKIPWTPYFRSLPPSYAYETLFQWSLEEIQTHLNGTTLGQILLLDRMERSTEQQYRSRVQPFLEKIGLLDQTAKASQATSKPLAESPDYLSFLEAAMCISTRGFHLIPLNVRNDGDGSPQRKLTTDDQQESTSTAYNGPFLLPVIDLLNHDPPNACTTLQRDPSTGSFVMVAERSLKTGEAVVHSYGNEMTSAQLLQTFGFVPLYHSQDVCLARRRGGCQGGDTEGMQNDFGSTNQRGKMLHGLTPAHLHKVKHLLAACERVKKSSYPQYVRETLIQKKQMTLEDADEEEDEDEYIWDVHDIPNRPMEDTMPEEFLVSISNNDNSTSQHFFLSEELLTMLAVQFLPDDAYSDIFLNGDRRTSGAATTLDRSILTEDYYLRMLVCRSLLEAIDRKVDEYANRVSDSLLDGPNDSGNTMKAPYDLRPVPSESNNLVHIWTNDQRRLEHLLAIPQVRSVQEEREVYGLTIRMEELANLKMLYEEVQDVIKMPDGMGNSGCRASENLQPPNKRLRNEE